MGDPFSICPAYYFFIYLFTYDLASVVVGSVLVLGFSLYFIYFCFIYNFNYTSRFACPFPYFVFAKEMAYFYFVPALGDFEFVPCLDPFYFYCITFDSLLFGYIFLFCDYFECDAPLFDPT